MTLYYDRKKIERLTTLADQMLAECTYPDIGASMTVERPLGTVVLRPNKVTKTTTGTPFGEIHSFLIDCSLTSLPTKPPATNPPLFTPEFGAAFDAASARHKAPAEQAAPESSSSAASQSTVGAKANGYAESVDSLRQNILENMMGAYSPFMSSHTLDYLRMLQAEMLGKGYKSCEPFPWAEAKAEVETLESQRREIHDLKSKLGRAEGKLKDDAEVQRLTRIIADKDARIASQNTEGGKLIGDLRRAESALQIQTSTLMQECDRIRAAAREDNQRLNNANANQAATIMRLTREQTVDRERIKDLEFRLAASPQSESERVADLTAKLAVAEKRARDVVDECHCHKSEANEKNLELMRLKETLHNYERNLGGSGELLKAKDEEIQMYGELIAEQNARLGKANDEIKHCAERVANREAMCESLTNQLHASQNTRDSLNADNRQLRDRLVRFDELQGKLQQVSAELKAQLERNTDLVREIKDLQGKNESWQRYYGTAVLPGRADTLAGTISRLNNEVKILTHEKGELVKNETMLRERIENQSMSMKNYRADTVKAEARADACRELLESAWGLIANAGGGHWASQGETWQDAAIRWKGSYANLKAGDPVSTVSANVNELERELAEARSERDHYKELALDLNRQLEGMASRRDAKRAELEKSLDEHKSALSISNTAADLGNRTSRDLQERLDSKIREFAAWQTSAIKTNKELADKFDREHASLTSALEWNQRIQGEKDELGKRLDELVKLSDMRASRITHLDNRIVELDRLLRNADKQAEAMMKARDEVYTELVDAKAKACPTIEGVALLKLGAAIGKVEDPGERAELRKIIAQFIPETKPGK